jgi:hypothetical protein
MDSELFNETGNWIKSLSDWQWFATFSYKYPTSSKTANHLWRKRWLYFLEKEVNQQVHFVRTTENEADNIHFHCLLSGIGNQNPTTWERAWLWGIAEIRPYNPERGGAHYIGSKIASGHEVVFSKNIEKRGNQNERNTLLPI